MACLFSCAHSGMVGWRVGGLCDRFQLYTSYTGVYNLLVCRTNQLFCILDGVINDATLWFHAAWVLCNVKQGNKEGLHASDLPCTVCDEKPHVMPCRGCAAAIHQYNASWFSYTHACGCYPSTGYQWQPSYSPPGRPSVHTAHQRDMCAGCIKHSIDTCLLCWLASMQHHT